MVEVRGSCVGHFLWTSYMGDLKDNNHTKKNKCLESKRVRYSQNFKSNYRTSCNLIISPLTQISRTTPLIWHLLFQSQQWKRQNNVWNMFKVNNNKDAPKLGQWRHPSFLLLTLNIFGTLFWCLHC